MVLNQQVIILLKQNLKQYESFEELFNLLIGSSKQNKEYENIKNMRDEEKIVSYMNNYFVFIKTTEVDK